MEKPSRILGVFDTKPYDREYLTAAAEGTSVEPRFHNFRLEEDTCAAAAGCSAVCVFVNDVADRKVLDKLGALGVGHLALRCAGFNNVDLEAARAAGIVVTRVPGYSPHAVAEHTAALLLALNRKIHRAFNRVRELNFSLSGLVGFDLHGKTAGIIGTGRIGRLFAEILRGFKMRVLLFDVHPDEAWAAANGMAYVPMEDLLSQSDVVSLHTPLTPQTHHLINAPSLATMKRGVVILNVSRGALIDTVAVIAALKSGHVAGVALDVYEEEEGVFFEDLSGEVLMDDVLARLLTFPNVLITAHQAFLTREALFEISRVTIDNVLRVASGRSPLEGTML